MRDIVLIGWVSINVIIFFFVGIVDSGDNEYVILVEFFDNFVCGCDVLLVYGCYFVMFLVNLELIYIVF